MTTKGAWIVAVFLNRTLVVDACGPYRSESRANEISDRINADSQRADMEVVAQVVQLTDLNGILHRVEVVEG